MVGNCALGSQMARAMLLGHCGDNRALLGWLDWEIRREIMRGWWELCVGCCLSVGIGRTVSVQVLVAKTDIGDTVVLTARSALVSCMKEGLVKLEIRIRSALVSCLNR